MSNPEDAAPVVVGIDGSEDALLALDWAAAEAARHGWPLRLVNAYQTPVAALPAVAVSLPSPIDESEKFLDEAKERVARSHPELPVTTVRLVGPAPQVLLDESAQARMLVVGREGLSRMAELVLGSVSLACAMHAKTPVAVVPASWTRPATPYDRVVVGVDGSDNCQAAVKYAFGAAAERGAELVAVYAWYAPTRWPEGWPIGADMPEIEAELNRDLVEFLSKWRATYPQVAVRPVAEFNHPTHALARHAAEADLVVIGGRGHGTITGALLGSVARAILRSLDRPTVVVHQP
ncbi:MAG: universal stress protein [Actinomycetota bacterium]